MPKAAGCPTEADPAPTEKPPAVQTPVLMVVYATRVCGPIVAMQVGLSPTRVRYASVRFSYHICYGWLDGLLLRTGFALVAQTGKMYNALWYPFGIAVHDRVRTAACRACRRSGRGAGTHTC